MLKSWLLVLILAPASQSPALRDDDGLKAFEQLRTLVGEWRGTAQWSGARTESYPMNASYHLTGNGSAVVEDLIDGGAPQMMSVYHLDGRALRMTHYCGAQNQPRLKARSFDRASSTIEFEFVDATNLASPNAPHVHGLIVRIPDHDHLELQFMFDEGAKHSVERITLTRARVSPQ